MYRVENEWPTPEARQGWTLVKVLHAGICGSDIPRFASTGSYRHPMILGHEFSGAVESPAPGSERWKKGDVVGVLPLIPCGSCRGCRDGEPFHCEGYQFLGSRNDGGFAEYCLVPEENLFPLPRTLDPRAGALVEPIAVALHTVRRSGFVKGQSALVIGAGAIGLLTGLWLRAFGASRVVMADIRPESLSMAERIGLTETVDLRDEACGREGFRSAAGGFDACFEAAGSREALGLAVEMANDGGTVTVVGRDKGDTVIPHGVFERLMRRELSLRGCWGYNLRGDERLLARTLEEGGFSVLPMVTREISLDEAPEVIGKMINRDFYYCKVLIGF
jgi:L-iditol 2-dehydrogenase